ncbi:MULTISPECIES: M56 family metallopeptidase [unclassified Paenibacillus]|uniref:M56 family metallopeptidase n=1 Tax=unclassified Paenibacillus TaxID=185978 RepID=UPI0009A70F5E|nr:MULTISPECIES: M56 family metallopeptidase [unclassified Paenibacillus]SLK09747.1 Signal transducer regulating beta-lactamase production, contains metallopeptidase domain [Paenibacillus sp. RU5A]SOC71715.1 Signal transducer regulating beta-lactamase production, contains metallopeptidase domain [Paenibacillus sp. RU26A]SOC74071.1 Signal transducer regulating beta-lactamase production, contains metallopeptidase domain [Paenibacillus sp. RU5M]
MNSILVLLSTLTVAGSVVVAFILSLRLAPFQVIPAKWRFGIGKMALVLYLLPIFLVFNWIFSLFTSSTTVNELPLNVQQVLPGAFNPTPAIQVQTISANVALALICLWVIGVIAFAAWQTYCYHRFLKTLKLTRTIVPKNSEVAMLLPVIRENLGLKSEVRLAYSALIRSPFLIGLRKPTIYLPLKNSESMDIGMVLRHELIHLKRKDLWIKALILVARALHWFNPLVHLLSKDIHTWSELSCDEEVVKGMTLADRKRYGETILNVVAGSRNLPIQFCSSLSGDGKQLKRRLNFMLNVKNVNKKTFVIAISTLFVVGAVSTVTTAWASSNTPRVVASEEASAVTTPSQQTAVREEAPAVTRPSAQATAREEVPVVTRPSAQAAAREEAARVTRPSVQAVARQEAPVVTRPSAQAIVPEESPVVARSAAQPTVREEAAVVARPSAQAAVREEASVVPAQESSRH